MTLARARVTRPAGRQKGNRLLEYRRVSKGREEMISPEIQQHANESWASREGKVIVGVHEDLDNTGRDFAKRKIAEMIETIRRGEADGIVVYKVSRWGRNLTDSLINIRALEEAGGYIASSTENLGEIDTPHGRFSLNILLVIAELQSDQIRESWIDSQWQRISRGLPANGKPRFGYTYDKENQRFDPNPTTISWLKRAYEDYVTGRPLGRVVVEMQEKGIKGTSGANITESGLLFILDSGFGAGRIIIGARRGKARKQDPIYLSGAQEPCISEETWEAYLAKRSKPIAPRDGNPTSPISRLVYCASCGRRLARTSDGNKVTWACRKTRYNSGVACANKVSMYEHLILPHVRQWLVDHANGVGFDEAAEVALAINNAKADLAALLGEEQELRTASLNVEDRLNRGKISEADADVLKGRYTRELAECRARITKARKTADGVAVPMPEQFDVLVELWDEWEAGRLDLGQFNSALSEIIGKVVIHAKDAAQRVQVVPRWHA